MSFLHRRLTGVLSFFAATLVGCCADGQEHAVERLDLYTRGNGGYHTYRIPSVIVTARGDVLAFCEGRKISGNDTGDIDLLVRRSRDGGRSFAPFEVVWDDGGNTCGNPCPVIDRDTNTIWLLMTHNLGRDNETAITKGTAQGTRTVWVTHSTDDGRTWNPPKNITASVKDPAWTWFATGPGAGVQLRDGRLVIPCDHRDADLDYSHAIFSDDHGVTWQRGGRTGPGCNECELIERRDGTLLLNMRNYHPPRSHRAVAVSRDRGITWSAPQPDPVLLEPTCQASIRRMPAHKDGVAPDVILFSNPASQRARKNLTVRLSRDDAATWPVSRVLHSGPSAYSCLAFLSDGTVLCLFENGAKDPYEKITLSRFPLSWLTEPRE
jgi:sialidase-1